MKPEIEIIPTLYDGILFRSRIEARWAVFYNALKIKYDYEMEGFKIGKIKYLPDFYIPHLDCFIEIKGKEPTEIEKTKCSLLSQKTNKMVYLFFGQIPRTDFDECNNNSIAFYPPNGEDYNYYWCECLICGFLGIEFEGFSDRLKCKHGKGDRGQTVKTDILINAYQKARSARFEFD